MMRPAWRDFAELWTLSVTRGGVLHVAQVTKYGSRWKIRVFRADKWGTSVNLTVDTKTEAQDIGAAELGYPVPKREPKAPSIAQVRAAVKGTGIEIDDVGDCYEAFAPEGSCFDGDLHSMVYPYDEGDPASKRSARRELFDDLKDLPLEPCDPDSENCKACGCFPENK